MKKQLLIFLIGFGFSIFQLSAQESYELKADALIGDLSARHLGPALMSGRVIDLEVHPTNNKVLYVGSAGGGVWKTADGGVTYRSIFDKHAQSIGSIALDPKNPDEVIWVGTGEIWTRNSVSIGDGLYKSTDGGKNWKKMGLDNSERIANIIVHPDNSDVVFVAVLGALWGDSEERGIYKTEDGGETWEKIFYINPTTGCSELIMDPTDSNIMYASFWEFRRTAYSFNSGGPNSALYKSIDGGKNWSKIHKGFPSGDLGRIAVAIAPSKPEILYSVIECGDKSKNGLYRSDDAGASWAQLNKDFELTVRPFYFSRIVVDPMDENKVCKAGLRGSISEDGGKTFRSIGSGVHADVHDFAFNVSDSDVVYLGCDGGVYRSLDGGIAWEMAKGLPLSQYYHVTMDNEKPFNVYGGLQDNGSWIGPSSAPGGVSSKQWTRVGFGDGFRVYPHPKNSNIVYSEMQGAERVWRVNVEKGQFKNIKPYEEEGDPKLRFNWNTPFATSAHNADRLFIGSQFLHVSDDRGEAWRKISPDLTTNDPAKQQQETSGGLSMDNSGAENHCTIFTIGESILDENVIWVGTDDGNVQITQNGGKNWKNVTSNLKGLPRNTWCYHIEPSSFDKGTAYAVFDGHTRNDHVAYVYKTTDFGASWTNIATDDIHGFVRSIQEDYVNPNLLYVGSEFGLFISLDGGKNWTKFTNNVPAVAIHHLELHPRDHSLVLATHGRGIIIIDDITSLRQLTPEIAEKKVHFFDAEPSIIHEGGGSLFGGSDSYNEEFVGAGKSQMAQIKYYLKSRHVFGKMRLEVLDDTGKKVADLSPGKAKGINTVNWNYRYRMPKTAKGKTFSFNSFTTPTVPTGEYTIRMTKGKEVYTTKLELVKDPTSIYAVEDRKMQHDVAMDLYNKNEELAYMIHRLDHMQESFERMKVSDKLNKKVYSKINKLDDELSKFKKTLVVTTGDNYVGSAEPQLREKISFLYGEVAGYMGKPSDAQLKNKALLSKELMKANKQFSKYLDSLEKINVLLEEMDEKAIAFPSMQEFLEAS